MDSYSSIIAHLHLPCTNPQTLQEECFNAVWQLCRDGKWGVLTAIHHPISQIVNANKDSLLSFSVKQNNEDVFSKLLEKQIVALDVDRNLPIHIVAKLGHLVFLKTFFGQHSASVGNKWHQTPLHLAAANGQKEVVDYLLLKAPQTIAYTARWLYRNDIFELTPPALAVLEGHILCVDLFLQHPNIDACAEFKRIGNLLHLAIFAGQNKLLKRFLTLYFKQFSLQLNACNDQDQTPLMLAARLGNLEAMQLLLDKNAHIDRGNALGNTALHWAVLGKQKKAVQLLLDHDAASIANREGKTAKQLAESNRDDFFERIEKKPKLRVLGFQDCRLNWPAYTGALKVLELCGMMNELKFVAGTSTGSLTAAFTAINLTSAQTTESLNAVNFSEGFKLGSTLKKAPSSSTLFSLFYTTVSSIASPIQLLKKGGEMIWNMTGLRSGEAIREKVEEIIFHHTGIPFFTFGDLQEAIQQGKPYRHFYLFTTKLGSEQSGLVINSEDPEWKDVILSDAVTGAMLKPVTFSPLLLHIKLESKRVPHPGLYALIDGFNDYSLDYFDRKRFSTSNYAEQDSDFATANSLRSLDFSIYEPTDKNKPDKPPSNALEMASSLLSPYTQKSRMDPRTIRIPIAEATEETHSLGFNACETFLFSTLGLKPIAPAINHPPLADQVTLKFSVPPALPPGVFAFAVCENISCKDLYEEQWIPLNPVEGRLNIGEIEPNHRCPCCKNKFGEIKKIALSNRSCNLTYGDRDGVQTNEDPDRVKTKPYERVVVEWTGTPRYLRLDEIK